MKMKYNVFGLILMIGIVIMNRDLVSGKSREGGEKWN